MFAEIVRARRQRLGLTQEELAANACLGLRTIRKIEGGLVATPRPATVRLLADAFGLADADREAFCQTAAGETSTVAPRAREADYPATALTVPMQLPADVSAFTGREEQLAYLDAMLAGVGDQPNAALICALSGTAGVGKTALAVHWAHQVRDRYPDGQLFIDLHGYTQGMDPIEPGEGLERMLRALGVPGAQIPAGLDERAALYRTRLAGRRVLVVLDNAASETQVAPLMPGAQSSLALVTSRRQLAIDCTGALSLDVLPVRDAVALFVRIVGNDRIPDLSAAHSAELVELCGRLPLAIRIAAARLRSHPSWHLTHLVERLRDQRHRLGELATGQRSVNAALHLSYRHLSPAQQLAYRLLGLHPGRDFDARAVAALLDSTPLYAGRMLDRLLEANLLHEPVPGRYRFHDLTRAHAARTAVGPYATAAPEAALGRLLDYYRHTASVAMDVAYPCGREHRSAVPSAGTPGPQLPDPAAALGWLDTELPNLVAAAQYATEHNRPEYLLHLSAILHSHLAVRGCCGDTGGLHQRVLTTASTGADQSDQPDQAGGLGRLAAVGGRRRADDVAQAHNVLAHAHHAINQHEQARQHWQRALDILTELGADTAGDAGPLADDGDETTTTAIRSNLAALAALTDRSAAG